MLDWIGDLLSSNNFWILFFSALPGIIYSVIIYLNVPKKAIFFKTGIAYFCIGLLSLQIVQYVHMIFPDWGDYLYNLGEAPIFLFIHAFIQVALLEEMAKYTGFVITDKIRGHRTVTDHPIATMFYSGMAALSFATVENFFYAMRYGEDVLVIRALTATVLHMLAGFLIGYFIALSRMKPNNIGDSIFAIFMGKYPRIRRIYYTTIGLLVAVCLHGAYDYNLFLGGDSSTGIMIVTLIVGLALTYLGGKHLIRLSVEKKYKVEEIPDIKPVIIDAISKWKKKIKNKFKPKKK